MGLGTVWFLWNLNQESISDFAAYKKWMLLGFGAIGVSACIFVRDFPGGARFGGDVAAAGQIHIGYRALARFALAPGLVVWAYLWVVAGIWFTISPWRMRDR